MQDERYGIGDLFRGAGNQICYLRDTVPDVASAYYRAHVGEIAFYESVHELASATYPRNRGRIFCIALQFAVFAGREDDAVSAIKRIFASCGI